MHHRIRNPTDTTGTDRRYFCRLLAGPYLGLPGLILSGCASMSGNAWQPPPWWRDGKPHTAGLNLTDHALEAARVRYQGARVRGW